MSITGPFKTLKKDSWISFTVFMKKILVKTKVNDREGLKGTEEFREIEKLKEK
jgi:hypothetical protein